jgi:hypothetical protein
VEAINAKNLNVAVAIHVKPYEHNPIEDPEEVVAMPLIMPQVQRYLVVAHNSLFSIAILAMKIRKIL